MAEAACAKAFDDYMDGGDHSALGGQDPFELVDGGRDGIRDALRELGKSADGVVRRQVRGYWARLRRAERKAARGMVSKAELRERRRLETEERAQRRSEGGAAREAQRVRDEVIAEIEGAQPGVPLGLAPRERPAWVVGGG